jgi:small-conductance mechanosensitive channel
MSANYTVGEASFDFSKILIIVVLFFLFRSFISLGRASLEHLPERLPNIERGVIPPLGTMLTYGLWALFAIIALGMLGVNFTSLAVVAGGLSVGIGFGMQNIFNNLISGLMLIFGRTLLVGDFVEIGGAAGTVRAISIRSTTIETAERALVYVPNSIIMAGQFINWTRASRLVRRSVIIGVAYESDTELVKSIMLEAAKKQDHVLQSPPPAVLFSNFGDNALEFTLNVFIDDLDYALSTLSALRFELDRAFRANNIDIPFPQLTLHTDVAEGAGVARPKPVAVKQEEPEPEKPTAP